jgi:hypothetical protein
LLAKVHFYLGLPELDIGKVVQQGREYFADEDNFFQFLLAINVLNGEQFLLLRQHLHAYELQQMFCSADLVGTLMFGRVAETLPAETDWIDLSVLSDIIHLERLLRITAAVPTGRREPLE